jgi:hypothetical protein
VRTRASGGSKYFCAFSTVCEGLSRCNDIVHSDRLPKREDAPFGVKQGCVDPYA